MKLKPLFIAAMLLFPVCASAQEVPLRAITVYGEARRDVSPDMARLTVNVIAKDRDLQKAKQLHDTKMQELLKIAASMQIERKDIKTQFASIQPEYDYQDSKQTFREYSINNAIEIGVKRMNIVGELMQKLVSAKFDNVGNVQYTIDNDLAYRDEVLLEALDNAKAKAAKVAERMGVTLGKPLAVQQGHQAPQPVPMVRAMAMEMTADAKMAGGGVQPPEGMMQINATVTVSYEIKD